jgi:hypothetical protein
MKVGDLVILKSSGRVMKVTALWPKTSQVCVLPADSAKANIALWVKVADIEVPGLRSASPSTLSI